MEMIRHYVSQEREPQPIPNQPPPRPRTAGIRIEGQRQGETYEEASKRIKKENKRFMFLVICSLTVLAIALIGTIIQTFLSKM